MFFRNLSLLHLWVLLLPFTVLLQNIHTTFVKIGENLISAQPRISAHCQGPKIELALRAVNRINTVAIFVSPFLKFIFSRKKLNIALSYIIGPLFWAFKHRLQRLIAAVKTLGLCPPTPPQL